MAFYDEEVSTAFEDTGAQFEVFSRSEMADVLHKTIDKASLERLEFRNLPPASNLNFDIENAAKSIPLIACLDSYRIRTSDGRYTRYVWSVVFVDGKEIDDDCWGDDWQYSTIGLWMGGRFGFPLGVQHSKEDGRLVEFT